MNGLIERIPSMHNLQLKPRSVGALEEYLQMKSESHLVIWRRKAAHLRYLDGCSS